MIFTQVGPLLTYWFNVMERILPGRAPARVAAKLVIDQVLQGPFMIGSMFALCAAVKGSAEINQCVRPAWRYYLLFWPPRRSARVLGVLARGVLGLLTRTFDFRTGEELSVEQQIKNHIARESFGLGEVKIAPGAKKGDGGGAEGWVEKAEVVLA